MRDKRTGRKHTVCIGCRRAYCRAYHYRDPDAYNARRRALLAQRRARNRALVEAYLASHPCTDCGTTEPLVMEFDHVRGTKIREVSSLVRDGATVERLRAEIEKCEVRCANCHRKKTARDLWGRKTPVAEQGFSLLTADYAQFPSRGDCSSAG
ncbi:MAG TPA: hypothetical protein VMA36_10785 [Candidatus Limnocylindria bacterium]|nr:hypothetical protein [Candidatus Limnocylindria bacterium]